MNGASRSSLFARTGSEHQEHLQVWVGRQLSVKPEPLPTRCGTLGPARPTRDSNRDGVHQRRTGSELREQVDAIKRRYRNDWIALDNKLRSQ